MSDLMLLVLALALPPLTLAGMVWLARFEASSEARLRPRLASVEIAGTPTRGRLGRRTSAARP